MGLVVFLQHAILVRSVYGSSLSLENSLYNQLTIYGLSPNSGLPQHHEISRRL